MINKQLIQNKLASINDYYEELNKVLKNNNLEIVKDYLKLRAVERLFQLIVDTSIDINTHIISESKISIPDDYQSTFIVLAENNVLPMGFALKIAPSVGLRNKVVHKYGKVDIKKMVDDIRNEIGDFLEYVKIVNKYAKNTKKH